VGTGSAFNHQLNVLFRKEIRLRLTLDSGAKKRRIDLYIRRGENLLDALSRVDGVKVEQHREYGAWITEVDGRRGNWHFFINNAIPYTETSEGRLILSLSQMSASRSMRLEIRQVSDCADFEGTVTKPMLDFRTSFFLLERVDMKIPSILEISRIMRSSQELETSRLVAFWMLQSRLRVREASTNQKTMRAQPLDFDLPQPFSWGNRVPQVPEPATYAMPSLAMPPANADLGIACMRTTQSQTMCPSPSQAAHTLPNMETRANAAREEAGQNECCSPKTSTNQAPVCEKSDAHIDSSRAVFSPPGKQPHPNSRIKPVPLSRLSKLRAVIFDLDGVVVDSEKAHLLTFNAALSLLGIKVDEGVWRRKYTGVGSVAIIEDLFHKHGVKENALGMVEKRAKIYQQHIAAHGLPIITGFKSFHSFLLQNGIKVAIGSGGHRPHIETSLRSIGLAKTPFVGLEDVKHRKPAPDTFLLAAEKIGVKPSECLVVEDALSGMRAAAAAGMPCIALTTTLPRREIEGKAALVVRNFNSMRLRRTIRNLVAGKGNAPAKRKNQARKAKGKKTTLKKRARK